MAQVWRAQDLSLVRQVAIKILHPHLGTDDAFVARFRREAVASARLSHRSIVAIYDTLSEGGLEAIVMELIEGRTLRAVLDEAGVLPPADVVDVGVQISAALAEAHRAGIVHRDIKPANIMVGTDRRIMVTDFGIAKAQADADLTHTGTLLGTAKYLAPEQVAGQAVDARADIYALGIVLFEAATGKPPFLAETDAGTALARLQGEVPRCRHLRATVPVGLDEVIARAMAKEPDDRYERATALRAALTRVDLTNVRTDTADLGPTTGTPAPGSGAPRPVSPPTGSSRTQTGPVTSRTGPGGAAPVPPPGTAVLTTRAQPRPQQAGGPPGKPTRKQRKAAKKASKYGAPVPPALPSRQGRPPAGPSGGVPRGMPAGKPPRKGVMPIEGRQRPTKTIVAALIIGGLLVSGVLLFSLLDQGQSDTGDLAAPVIVSATPFDPEGDDGAENNDLAPNAIDGDPDTRWRTARYNRAEFAGLKTGVGLILALEDSSSLSNLELLTGNEGWDAQVFVGDEFGPNDDGFDLEALGDPVATIEGGGESESISLDGQSGSAVLLWITETGTSININGDRVFRFVVFEASID
ncbi:UNVERIFIED_CONTAM: hypothetical protein GTU68_055788 [Idotea baltica]|nr:hypothetical protein [Idotea baltica]